MQIEEATTYEVGAGVFADRWLLALEKVPHVRCERLDAVLTTYDGDYILTVFGGESLPSMAQNGRVCAIFDGELYSRAGLIKQLDLAPDVSNAGVILRGYQEWGSGILKRLRGVFALAIWDGETLLCVRDPLGAFPLFYAIWGGSLLVSTSVRAFHENAGLPYHPNRLALADYLLNRWNFKEETFYDDVFRVPSGHALTVRQGVPRAERYWLPVHDPDKMDWVTERDLGQFEDIFDQTVNRFFDMGSGAIYLSGGLDSVSVAAVMAQNSRMRHLDSPLALSVLFPAEANEAERQRAVADQLGMPFVGLPFDEAIGSQGLLQATMDFTSRLAMPLLNPWLPAYHRLASEGRSRGARIILTGGGGDEWLTVDPSVVADMMRSLDVAGIVRFLQATRRSYPARLRRVLSFVLWRFGLKPVLRQVKYRALYDWLRRPYPTGQSAPALAGWLAPDPGLKAQLWVRAGTKTTPKRIKSFYLDDFEPTLDRSLVSAQHEEIFEVGSMLGVRVFQPFWDVDMVEFLHRVPPKLLMKGGRTKGLVRESIARRFPQLGFEQQKKISSLNVYAGLVMSQWATAWAKLGGLQALADHKIIDEQAVTTMLQTIHDQYDLGSAHRLWQFLNLEIWLRTHSA